MCFLRGDGIDLAQRERRRNSGRSSAGCSDAWVSLILVGHNEEDALEKCLRSLKEQSYTDFETVIVSDGSTDRMSAVSRQLVKRGLADRVLSTDLRGGKSSGINLACRMSRGDIIINVDCDCSFDRYAIEHLVRALDDPSVAAACGDVAPRNADESNIAQFQEIEYLQSISVGKRLGNAIDQVVCASGGSAPFAEPRSTMSAASTSAAARIWMLRCACVRRIGRSSTHRRRSATPMFPPRRSNIYASGCAGSATRSGSATASILPLSGPSQVALMCLSCCTSSNLILFNLIAAAAFPFYLLWLFAVYGSLTPMILVAAQAGLLFLDISTFLLAAWVTPKVNSLRLLPFVVGYSIFNGIFMRLFRLTAYVQEWIFNASSADPYSPAKVQLLRRW